jgi:hypothetical protein
VSARALIVALALAAPAARAQSVRDLDDWMDRIDEASQSVQKRIARRDRAQALADARELVEMYELMEGFFRVRASGEDGVRFSRAGRDIAVALRTALDAGKFDNARARAIELARACRDCHFKYKPL